LRLSRRLLRAFMCIRCHDNTRCARQLSTISSDSSRCQDRPIPVAKRVHRKGVLLCHRGGGFRLDRSRGEPRAIRIRKRGRNHPLGWFLHPLTQPLWCNKSTSRAASPNNHCRRTRKIIAHSFCLPAPPHRSGGGAKCPLPFIHP